MKAYSSLRNFCLANGSRHSIPPLTVMPNENVANADRSSTESGHVCTRVGNTVQ